MTTCISRSCSKTIPGAISECCVNPVIDFSFLRRKSNRWRWARESPMKGKVLVAGIGNIFMGDDAFGVEVVKRLKERAVPEHIEVIDFGIRSYDLAYALMEEWDLTILIDALPLGGAPGTLYTLEPELPNNSEGDANLGANTDANFDAHTMNPVAVLQLVSALGGRTGRILVVGCEPGNVEISSEGDLGLTLPVRRAVDEAVKMVEQLIARARHTTLAA